MTPAQRRLLIVAMALVLLYTVVRFGVSWNNYSSIDGTAGVWSAIAFDVSQGDFYRPLEGDDGFGGTRYFPLYFILHGALIALGVPVVPAGIALSLLSVAALAWALFRLLRRLDAPPLLAATGCTVLLVSTAVQQAISTVRADAAATAFLVFGLGFCLGKRPRDPWIAGLFFTLAFATKVTALYGAGAGFLLLLFAGRTRDATRLVAATAAGVVAVAVVMHLGSGGRVFGIMAACGTAGLGLVDILKAPSRMLYFMTHLDTAALLTFFLAVLAILGMDWRTRRGPGGVLLLAAVGAVTVIYASPGTNYNQLIDVQVASIVALVAWACADSSRRIPTAATALAGLMLIAMHPLGFYLNNVDRAPLRQGYEAVSTALQDVQGPVLSENPVVPVMAGRRAWVLDPFMFRVLNEKDASIGAPLYAAMDRREIGAVVLSHADPRTLWGGKRLSRDLFGKGFLEALERNYELAHELEGQLVYLPRSP